MVNGNFSRRDFTRRATLVGAGVAAFRFLRDPGTSGHHSLAPSESGNLKISLNAFSFDKPLKAGTMTIDDMLDYCSKIGFDGVDLTGYYFPGYPDVPSDEYIYHIRR